jgi:hypothetical protein
MLEEADHVAVCHMVEEAFDVGLDHPLGALSGNDLRHASQGIVCAAPRAETVRAIPELRFPDGLQSQTQPVLNQAILKAGHSERTVASTPLGDVDPPDGRGPIAHALQTAGQIGDPILQIHRILRFPYPIDSGRLLSVLALEAGVQPLRVKHQTHQGIEPRLRLLTRLLCETSQSCCHGQNPLCVGPCRPDLLPAHYRRSSLLWVAPTSDRLRPLPRF